MTDELFAFAADLGKVASEALPEADKILKKGAVKIKDKLRSDMAGSTHFGQIAPSISFDSAAKLGSIGYEIGPDKDRNGGALANVAYFGTSRGGGTVEFGSALTDEAPIVEKHLDDLVKKWVNELAS